MIILDTKYIHIQVHDMMDDIAEQQDVAKEISEAISSPVAFGQVRCVYDG